MNSCHVGYRLCQFFKENGCACGRLGFNFATFISEDGVPVGSGMLPNIYSAERDGYIEEIRRTLRGKDYDKKWTDECTVFVIYKILMNNEFIDVMFSGSLIRTDSHPETNANIDCYGFYL